MWCTVNQNSVLLFGQGFVKYSKKFTFVYIFGKGEGGFQNFKMNFKSNCFNPAFFTAALNVFWL